MSRKFNLSSLTPNTKFSSLAKDQDLKTYQRSVKLPQSTKKPNPPSQTAQHLRGNGLTSKVPPQSAKKPEHLRSNGHKPQGNRMGRYLVSPPKRGRYVILNSLERNNSMSLSQNPQPKRKDMSMSFQSMKEIIFNTKNRA